MIPNYTGIVMFFCLVKTSGKPSITRVMKKHIGYISFPKTYRLFFPNLIASISRKGVMKCYWFRRVLDKLFDFIVPFWTQSPEPNGSYLAKIPPKTKQKQLWRYSRAVFGAVGESRTHTPQRALPPQSSVSTISPLPRIGTANIRQKSESANYFSTFLCLDRFHMP